METVDCVLCGSNRHTVIYDKTARLQEYGHIYTSTIKDADGNILNGTAVMCEDCGLVFTNPRMTEDELEAFYRDEYRKIYGADITRLDANQYLHARHALEALTQCIKYNDKTTLLDIGCATGTFLEESIKCGFNVFGIEPNTQTYELARNKGLAVANIRIEDFNPSGRYDVITIQNTLEHLHNPVKMVRKTRELLADNGCLLISVPDLLTTSCYTHPDAWLSCAHLYHFTHLTLTQLMLKCGFEEHTPFSFQESIGDKLICIFRKCEPKEPELLPHTVQTMKEYLHFWGGTVITNYNLRVECSRYKGLKNPVRKV